MTKVNTPTEDNDEYTSNNKEHLEKVSNIYFYFVMFENSIFRTKKRAAKQNLVLKQ